MAAGTYTSESARSRRSLIRAGLAGLAGLALGALGRPSPASAAAGDPLRLGQSNSAGTSNTSLTTDTDTGTAFLVTQNGTATALRGVATNGIAGFFTSQNGSGVSGVVANKDRYGVYAGNDATMTGTGAAMRTNGKLNHGLVASTDSIYTCAVKATNTTAEGNGGVAILGLTGGWTQAQIPASNPAAGAFAGQLGVVGVGSVGVRGYSSTSPGQGIQGFATAADGQTIGVFGQTQSPSGYGVQGSSAAATGGTGVYGTCAGNGSGMTGKVYGTGVGVGGKAVATSGFCCGVSAECSSPEGWSLGCWGDAHFINNVAITGSVSKGSGSFKIDHPLDPAGKYLYHSFVESPDMLNVYSGMTALDHAGEAVVELPEWFEALNRDIRYQLTPIDRFSPLYVKARLKAGRFAIGGGEPGQEVCWLLTGIRKDAFAEAHRIPVEETKPADERGLYLHPVEHGQPASKSIGEARRSSLVAVAGAAPAR